MKTCNHEGCNYKQFGGGFCKRHGYLRPKKASKGIRNKSTSNGILRKVRKKGIRKISPRQTIKNQQKAELRRRDRELWEEIWSEREHICYSCNCYLGEEPLTLFFDHILEKGTERYAHLRYVKDNICLLCWDCHTNKAIIEKLIKLRKETIKKLIYEATNSISQKTMDQI